MDSKLVVEQMSGRWKIKHPDMRPLAAEANRLAPSGTTYTWVPREQNTHADRLANEALDGKRSGVTVAGEAPGRRAGVADRGGRGARAVEQPSPRLADRRRPADHAGPGAARRHAAHRREAVLRRPRRAPTPGSATRAGPRSGPPPTGCRRSPSGVDAVVASPVRRTLESAEILAETLGHDGRGRAGLRGDGVRHLGRADLRRGRRAATRTSLDAWLGSLETAPRGRRVVPRRSRSGCWPGSSGCCEAHPGKTVVVVSHVTPIKTLVAHALEAPLDVGVPDGADARRR